MRRETRADLDPAVARRLELLSAELAMVRGDHPAADGTTTRVRASAPDDLTHTRVRPRLQLAPPPTDTPPPIDLPVPGRHASRRLSRLGEAVPETLRGRVGLGPGQLAVLAVVAAAAVVLVSLWLVHSRGTQVPVPVSVAGSGAELVTPDAGGEQSDDAASPAAATGGRPAKVVVDVTGRVRHPGIAVLRSGARVVDALRAAGGARPGVDLGTLNLARVLVDGEQIVVGETAPAGVAASLPATSGAGTAGTPTGTLVDLNTADETALESLPEVGPVTAQSILTWRQENGAFTSVDELLEVDGIGDATLAKIAPYVTV